MIRYNLYLSAPDQGFLTNQFDATCFLRSQVKVSRQNVFGIKWACVKTSQDKHGGVNISHRKVADPRSPVNYLSVKVFSTGFDH